jgi:hypothetical protein
MACKSCQSENRETFNAELNIHFPGLRGLDQPVILVFPRLVVCLDCGFTELQMPEREVQLLKQSDSTAA